MAIVLLVVPAICCALRSRTGSTFSVFFIHIKYVSGTIQWQSKIGALLVVDLFWHSSIVFSVFMRPLAEQTILITGVTIGLGLALAQALAIKGATVLLH